MSLLVINSASKIAQGVIRNVQKEGKYERIVCGDLLHNYWGVQSQINFIGSRKEGTPLVDQKIQTKPDLISAIQEADKVVYVTHDYFTNVASKTRMINHVAEITKQLNKKLVAVTPKEHDHYGEVNANQVASQSEKEAKSANKDMTLIKSDLVFGFDSTVVQILINHLQNQSNICWQPSRTGPAPIHNNCLSHSVQSALDGDFQGRTFAAQGKNRIGWEKVLSALEQATQCHRQINASNVEKVASPLSNNLLSELLLNDKYRNLVQFINQYTAIEEGLSSISELGVDPLDFSDYYATKKLQKTDANDRVPTNATYIQQLLY